ncbi:MAG: hypothetical protein LPK19_15085 [Hymenobacteraceae bacterium]|nr:hypothetical protein [Hymenobacteraceae bacterium]MDX5513637.1 hypothetical protein [Hymenobacteraceae bacterium]
MIKNILLIVLFISLLISCRSSEEKNNKVVNNEVTIVVSDNGEIKDTVRIRVQEKYQLYTSDEVNKVLLAEKSKNYKYGKFRFGILNERNKVNKLIQFYKEDLTPDSGSFMEFEKEVKQFALVDELKESLPYASAIEFETLSYDVYPISNNTDMTSIKYAFINPANSDTLAYQTTDIFFLNDNLITITVLYETETDFREMFKIAESIVMELN